MSVYRPEKRGAHWTKAPGAQDRRWRCGARREVWIAGQRRCPCRLPGSPGTPTGHFCPSPSNSQYEWLMKELTKLCGAHPP